MIKKAIVVLVVIAIFLVSSSVVLASDKISQWSSVQANTAYRYVWTDWGNRTYSAEPDSLEWKNDNSCKGRISFEMKNNDGSTTGYTLDMEANSGGNGENKMSIGQYARVISASVKITRI